MSTENTSTPQTTTPNTTEHSASATSAAPRGFVARVAKSNFIQEFKEFINRGSVVDLAIGVAVGGAFTAIVKSLVDDIIMPLVGVATGGMNFTDYKWVIQKAVMDGQEVIKPEVTMNWGTWIQTIVDFLIVAFCIFAMIKFIINMRK